jgi:anti-sigma factor RsiW
MIDYELQLKLQAHLDGELSQGEGRRIAERLARDAEARSLAAELANTATALADFESDVRLPESREFFWSKIEREIRREAKRVPAAAAGRSPWWAGWRRWLAPAGGVAVVALTALVIMRPGLIPRAEAEIADPGAFTYRDIAARTTLVWLSYPAENEFAETDTTDTMD